MNAGWYFTAPWDPVSIRRGDALGLRAGADYFADLIAPGLSNATSDARWITLLSWCLKWSHIAWQNAGSGNLAQRDDRRARYAWLRPLELQWVDRTLESGQTSGQLRGRLSVDRWRKADRKSPDFAMSPDQYRRYRQIGTYGAYRVVFRTVAGLTVGDGWTPDVTSLALAELVNRRLPPAARLRQEFLDNGTRWGSWRDQEARFWIKHGWPDWKTKAKHGFLPTPEDAVREILPEEERCILEPALFDANSVRRMTAKVLANAKGARSHAELCDSLANSTELAKMIESKVKTTPTPLAPLPHFTRFADAAMDTMRTIWDEIKPYYNNEKDAPTIESLARSTDLKKLERLRKASTAWISAPGRDDFPHHQVATQLAKAMCDATSPVEQLRALARHHHEHGGGRRWFREQAGKFVPLVGSGIAASNYRFRLRPICLLAAQCGVANMKNALDALSRKESDDEEEDAL